MAYSLQSDKPFQLFKDQTLGVGSYGKVCKANYNGLLCAAKVLHPTLFDPTNQLNISPQKQSRLPFRRFEQECELLSTMRHPNIIQYLGMEWDPDTGLPILLMELMDSNLTNYLEKSSSLQKVPYNIQVNFSHDISLALSFLHSSNILHRDLSSNNVLLISDVRAKVADFGMARLLDVNCSANQYHSLTVCPGTNVYMPPEAVESRPSYSEKIDCFSFGVIVLQIITQEFPNPGDRHKRVAVNDPHFPSGTVEVRCSEIERRQNHINKVDPNNPLFPIILDCLNDEDHKRPSSLQLCERLRILRESVNSETTHYKGVKERFRSEWKKGENAPCRMSRSMDAVVDGNTVYFRPATSDVIYTYKCADKEEWQQLRKCPTSSCSLAVICGLITTIGGCHGSVYSNNLFSLEAQSKDEWVEMFPPMSTRRKWATALSTDNILVVAGGTGRGEAVLSTVEVMRIENNQWFSVADLPDAMTFASAACCGDRIYMLGGWDKDGSPVKSVYTCLLSALLSSDSRSQTAMSDVDPVWSMVADLPVTCSTAVSLHDHLLALGGEDFMKPTSALHLYNPNSDTWDIIGHMSTARSACLAAVLQDSRLMVVGGINETVEAGLIALSSVELCNNLGLS